MSDLVKSGSKYSDEDRRRAVIEHCTHGVMTRVSDVTGIPTTTLAHWKNKSDWWDDLVAQVRSEINERILAQNLEIATKAGERVLDSLENGDEKLVWDKHKGEHVIKLVKPTGKDAAVIGGISQDKARIQLNLPTSISSNVGSREHLEALAKQFEELAMAIEEKRVNSIPGECEEVGEQE
ncbi:MAG: hypothetical protein O3A13_15630 [Proteobacteria bacterium]|nr:hypothetical protein [Pseudomonadota bacterium]